MQSIMDDRSVLYFWAVSLEKYKFLENIDLNLYAEF